MDNPRYESDYSLNYYLNVEILKDAFLIAFNVYDKVAFLINDYEELSLKDQDVSFWNDKSILTIKGNLMEKEEYNKNIVGLFSIKKEIEKEEFTKIKEIRNLIAHRYFILHDIDGVENSNYHMDIQDFLNLHCICFYKLKIFYFLFPFLLQKKKTIKEKLRKKKAK